MPDDIEVSPDGRSSTYTYGPVESPPFETQLRRALKAMGGDPDKAGALMLAWMEQDSELRSEIIPALVAYYVRANVERLAEETAK